MTACLTLTLPDPDATTALAHRIAPHLRPGRTVLLRGPVGAGKTHFARALVQSLLTRHEDVPSPTFTLVQTYDTSAGEIWHADLYRLHDPGEVAELGLDEAFERAICLVEWPERLGPYAPENALMLTLAHGSSGEGRLVTLSASSACWAPVFDAVRNGAGADA